MTGKIKRRSLRYGGRPKADFGSLFTSVIAPALNAAGSIADESIDNNKTVTNGVVNNNTTIPGDPTKTPTMRLGGRKKCWIGAAIGAATSIAGSLFGNSAQKREMRRQQSIRDWQNATQEAANMTSVLNNSRDYQEDYLRQFRTAARLGKRLGAKGIYITDGGDATKIGNNTYLLRGGSHEDVNETGQTGIGINVGGNEVEAEGGEVAQKKNGALRIFSAQPILGNGMSPAQAILRGYNKDAVFSQQQAFKKRNGLKDDGSKLRNGGLTSKDRGSSKHPYPSVSSKNFAGGGRSYPIPTKADAVDALRLAGLHGRSDVRSKVYSKYPSLRPKAAFGDWVRTNRDDNALADLLYESGLFDRESWNTMLRDIHDFTGMGGNPYDTDDNVDAVMTPAFGSSSTRVLSQLAKSPEASYTLKQTLGLPTKEMVRKRIAGDIAKRIGVARAAGRSQFIYRAGKYNNYSTNKETDAKKERLNRIIGARRIAKALGGYSRPVKDMRPKFSIGGKKDEGYDMTGELSPVVATANWRTPRFATLGPVDTIARAIPNFSAVKIPAYKSPSTVPYKGQNVNRSRTIFSGGDYLGLGIDTLAALSTGLVNYNTAGKYTLPDRAPIIQASKLPTTYNVNPEIEEIKRYRDRLTGQTFNNTSSSVAALNRSGAINLDALSNLSKLWATKENEENKMLTEDAKNQQTVAAQNVQNELARQSEIARIKNEAIQAKGDALNVGLSGLSQAWTNFWTAGRTAYEDDQVRRAMVASSKDATPTRLIEMGYDLSPDLVASLYRTAKDDRTKRFYLSRLSSAQRQRYGIN